MQCLDQLLKPFTCLCCMTHVRPGVSLSRALLHQSILCGFESVLCKSLDSLFDVSVVRFMFVIGMKSTGSNIRIEQLFFKYNYTPVQATVHSYSNIMQILSYLFLNKLNLGTARICCRFGG